MKTRVLFILLSVLFIIPVNAMSHKRHRHKVKTKIINYHEKAITRSPLFFNLTVIGIIHYTSKCNVTQKASAQSKDQNY